MIKVSDFQSDLSCDVTRRSSKWQAGSNNGNHLVAGCNSFIYYIFRPCYCSNASYTMLKMYIIVAQIEHMVSFHCS